MSIGLKQGKVLNKVMRFWRQEAEQITVKMRFENAAEESGMAGGRYSASYD